MANRLAPVITLLLHVAQGQIDWTQYASSTAGEQTKLEGLATDSSGNYYAGGWADGDFQDQTSLGRTDAVLAKFSTDGSLTWSRQFGTSLDDEVLAVATTSDAVYVVGECNGAMDGQTQVGSKDAFLKKYSLDGVAAWTTQFGSVLSDSATAVKVDSSGNVIVAGQTYGDFSGSNAGNSDVFVAKFTSAGVLEWKQQRGGTGTENTWALDIDDSNNIYVTGDTDGDLDSKTSFGGTDMFLMKFASDGTWSYTVTKGGQYDDLGRAMVVSNGNIWVAVNTKSTFYGLASSNFDYDLALVKFDSDGTELSGVQIGLPSGAGGTFAYDLGADSSGNIFAVGRVSGGGSLLGYDYQWQGGSYELFMMKFGSDGTQEYVVQDGCAGLTFASAMSVASTGEVTVGGLTSCALTASGPTDAKSDMFLRKYAAITTTTTTTTTTSTLSAGANDANDATDPISGGLAASVMAKASCSLLLLSVAGLLQGWSLGSNGSRSEMPWWLASCMPFDMLELREMHLTAFTWQFRLRQSSLGTQAPSEQCSKPFFRHLSFLVA